MKTEELETLLEGAEETDQLEFKGAMSWHLSLVKDMLALANVRDGGRIVIGIEDGTLARQGLSDQQLATFVPDALRDRVAEFADPEVVFSVGAAEDRGGLKFVVIDVSPFTEIPVLCKRDGPDIQKGAIYFRTRSTKPQSARVSNSNDMRAILEQSIARRGARLRAMGFEAAKPKTYDYDSELGGL
ncbi:ATP-binding protein [Mesorhizobium sp.]|uniref:AlbA family DNA-binding domain-containing protein n=1 Tax=Mesorhizobium sp. TaxID=1871066 RepID=UPI0012155FAB|nr:ATP-binding protein [Mesorhizobium sp.]TIN79753.1 MAG: ATP-binding protein [Mesorhizobium sp.]